MAEPFAATMRPDSSCRSSSATSPSVYSAILAARLPERPSNSSGLPKADSMTWRWRRGRNGCPGRSAH
jgi:hypothetical protein